MSLLKALQYFLLKYPLKLLVRSKIVPDDVATSRTIDTTRPIFYIVRHQSASDLLTLQKACRAVHLPDPLSPVVIGDKTFDRTLCLENPSPVLPFFKKTKTTAIAQGLELLQAHEQDESLDAQLVPVNLNWGRVPTKEKNDANVGTVIADQESPSWLRKFFIVLFLGRHNFVRFSQAVQLRYMADKHGSDEETAHKLVRVARFHFHRQTVAATGPRLMHRNQMFNNLLANPAVKKIIEDEARSKGVTEESVKKKALEMMDEIAGDYRDSMIRFGERVLAKLWNRLYDDIEVTNAQRVREVAQEGHEIIYVPCHRSHMDYLLLTYVIYHEGLVTPRIAAGINLNFWPAGPIFRKAGAFFIRRSFKGNRLYSTIFREYLGLLFERGYSVKYYTEGGRSRTGRLLQPKTGMLAMTIQSLLRGVDRPLTLVPVYLGYEHVMEVGTYHKELSGSQKKNESVFGVLKAIKSLRNYGKGYVNFGEPINLNQFLNDNVEDWKSAIDPIDPQKPNWLTPTVNKLANNVMTSINQATAVSGNALVAMVLHQAQNKALPKVELEAQLDFFLETLNKAPYSKQIVFPQQSGRDLLAHVIKLNKVSVTQDSFGDIVSLDEKASLEMGYYRNNIVQVYLLPSLVTRVLLRNSKIAETELIEQVQALMALIKPDLFLWQQDKDVSKQVKQTLAWYEELGVAKHTKAGFWSLVGANAYVTQTRAMAEVCDETLQRLAIIINLMGRLSPVAKSNFEENVVSIAKRLSVLNDINAPEFIDKKAQAVLISHMRELGLIAQNDEGKLITTESLGHLKTIVNNLIDIEVLQSIAR
ncbi:glycerol-3-phosphate 1-O-acyltransferase PlsB [Thalassotalea agarivorans]|uniref:Glycerol-3-phosphate acyltransferase n=1 Tax=Thalassotalea agarivorans TaxID=349064 RepID=A0A1I0CNS3_THASX|nr:glycerol-3-phosphate 1-O-acyltransferase PlsB [Thalassotalea agarivorans]SET21142.1 glycerol-3-phosphate acyltransferase [Thalassotalea agarivorans]